MKLTYSETQQHILVQLDEDETLGQLRGPTLPMQEATVPVHPGNREYDEIVARKLKIAAYKGAPSPFDKKDT